MEKLLKEYLDSWNIKNCTENKFFLLLKPFILILKNSISRIKLDFGYKTICLSK